MTDWNIQSRGRSCESCGKAFDNKEAYHTLLFDERRDWRRMDVCQGCWERQYSEARERKGFVSHWQGVFDLPTPPTEAIRRETAETLLRKIIEQNNPQYAPAAFILAVMLERKRLLKVKEQLERDGKRVFIYEQPGTGDIFTIVDPGLQLNQLEAVQRDVASLLEHGLSPDAAHSPDDAQPVEAIEPDGVTESGANQEADLAANAEEEKSSG
jgi:hypothetical protein